MSSNAQVDRIVTQLKERLDGNKREKEEEQRNQQAIAIRPELALAPRYEVNAYWCTMCLRDYDATGKLLIEGHGRNQSGVYVSECPDGHKNYRYVTDKTNDPYFTRSRRVQADRSRYADDFLNPHDPRFKQLYPEQWKRYGFDKA